MSDPNYTADEIEAMSMKEYRKKIPSGWMAVARFESMVLVIDALLSEPPSREFTETELVETAGIGARSFEEHVDSLVDLGVVEPMRENRDPVRYTLNEKSPIVQKLFDLNKTVEEVLAGNVPKSLAEDWGDSRGETNRVIDSTQSDSTAMTTSTRLLGAD